jgi:hypothetical protein
LDWVLLRFVRSGPHRFEFLWEKQIAKSSREGGEAVVVAYRGGLLASYFFDSVAGIVAAACGTGNVAVWPWPPRLPPPPALLPTPCEELPLPLPPPPASPCLATPQLPLAPPALLPS